MIIDVSAVLKVFGLLRRAADIRADEVMVYLDEYFASAGLRLPLTVD